MDVSIIMVNYNTLDMTKNAIKSIIEKTREINYELIIIDNASIDGSKEYFEKRKDIKYIYSTTNLGFGQANNLAAKHANGKYLFFLNSDTILKNNAIKILVNYLETSPKTGAVGGNLLNINNSPTISFERAFPGIFSTLNSLTKNKILYPLFFGKNYIYNYSDKPLKVAYISGADLMIPKILFDKLNGFYHKFFMYYEETDLCYRIHKLGYNIKSIPQAQIIHLEGGSQKNKSINKWKVSTMAYSRCIFMKHNFPSIYQWIDRLLMNLYFSLRNRFGKKSLYSIIEFEEFKKKFFK